jgi:hypothetical protein
VRAAIYKLKTLFFGLGKTTIITFLLGKIPIKTYWLR